MQQPTYNFTSTLEDLDAGVFLDKVSRAVRETSMAVAQNGDNKKKGKVTIELSISRIGDSRQVNIDHKLVFHRPTSRGKAYEENTTSTAMYVGKDGGLSIVPQSQTHLFATEHEKA